MRRTLTALLIIAGASLLPVFSAHAQSLQDTVDSAREAVGIPGCVVLMRLPGGKLALVTSGASSIEEGTAVAAEDLFRIGSITKTFLAVLSLKLEAEGYFSLEDPVAAYLPEIETLFGPVTDAETITIRDLLAHSSGLPDYVEILLDLPPKLFQVFADYEWQEAEIPEIVGSLPVDFAPGEGCNYSNTGYVLLGMTIERATGRSMAELLHEYIFDPLQLTDTYYAATERTPPQARGYLLLADGYHNVTALDLPVVASAAGCILADADDILRYAEALFGGELLTDKQWLRMAEWQVMGDVEYGLGLSHVEKYGMDFIGHSGGTLGYRAGMYWLPEADLIIVGLSNLGESDFGSVLTAAVRHVLAAD